MITVDVKSLLLCLVFIGLIVLIGYLIAVVKNLVETVKHTNKILADTEVVTSIVSEKAKESEQVIIDLQNSLSEFAGAMKGEENVIKSLSSIAKAISSLVSLLKKEK